MSNKEFVIKYYKDIKNACYKYYKITSYYIDFDDFFQDVLTLMLSNKAYDENLNVKPFTFICCVVKNYALQVKVKFQTKKRQIERDKLLSIDYINDDDGFKESNLAIYEEDNTVFITNDIIKKIKEKLSPKQLIYFDYMLQEYKPREVATITGDSGNYARKQYEFIRKKVKTLLNYYNIIIK